MNIMVGDSVIFGKGRGIVLRRNGDEITVRCPDAGDIRVEFSRGELRHIAEAMCDARKNGTVYKTGISLTGNSTLADLVEAFGYATGQMRTDSLNKVLGQLYRAGLTVERAGNRWDRDAKFKLIFDGEQREEPTSDNSAQPSTDQGDIRRCSLPSPFWPEAFGLDANREIAFLRALTSAAPLLCVFYLPDDSCEPWVQSTWEGIASWAYRCAQRFDSITSSDSSLPKVTVGPTALLHSYLNPSLLNSESPKLRDEPHNLNLIAVRSESEVPVELSRIRALWPGSVFEFRPERLISTEHEISHNLKSILDCLFLIGGFDSGGEKGISGLKALNWSKEAVEQLGVQSYRSIGAILSSSSFKKFRGSNENSIALSLKSRLAKWIIKRNPNAKIAFESVSSEKIDGERTMRWDLVVDKSERFEIETMSGSGPFENFAHKKVFSRSNSEKTPFSLVVPGESVLWAGPFLADLAEHLTGAGRVLLPCYADHGFFELAASSLNDEVLSTEIPWNALRSGADDPSPQTAVTETRIKIDDVKGYDEVRERIQELIIWPEKHRAAIRRPSRQSGILFFGPPGCGKSRLARAIAGELGHEVRLLSPSDLRGPYIGWGQIMMRDQFDWVAQNERRMLIIDEIDAIAHSRRHNTDMHTDEKANVNELLVQLDRVSLLGRIVVGTTNYIDSLDDAVVRSGRFGRFIPVPPPDAKEATAILEYYLKKLTDDEPSDGQRARITIPNQEELCTAVNDAMGKNSTEANYYCGADIEEAVNRTYLRCLRQTMKGKEWAEEFQNLTVILSKEEIMRSLREVSKSVTSDALRQFLSDTNRFCGSQTHDEMKRRLGIST